MIVRMTNHAREGREAAARIAGEVRAGLARQQKTQQQLAEVLGLTPATIGRRLAGKTPGFTVIELVQISIWLGIPAETLIAAAAA